MSDICDECDSSELSGVAQTEDTSTATDVHNQNMMESQPYHHNGLLTGNNLVTLPYKVSLPPTLKTLLCCVPF